MAPLSEVRIGFGVDGDDKVNSALEAISRSVKGIGEDTGQLAAKTQSATEIMASSFEKATGYIKTGAAALAAWQISKYMQEATMLAARVETLNVVMKVVGNNAGYTGSQMEAYASGVKKVGITTQESMNALVKMAGAQMDLSKASALARVAQNAAVIGATNSSEAFGRMIQGIQSGEVEILKTLGLNVQFEQGYKKTAGALGKTSAELSSAEKTASRMNEVLEYGVNIAGAYEASMTTAGKAIASLARPAEEIKLALGTMLTPALNDGVSDLTRSLNALADALVSNKDLLQDMGFWFKYAYFIGKTAVLEVANAFLIAENAANSLGGAVASAMYLLQGGSMNSRNPFAGWVDWFTANAANIKSDIDGINKEISDSYNKLSSFGVGGRTDEQEASTIAAGNARRAKQRAEELAAQAQKAAEAEINSYNQFTVAFNKKIEAIDASDPSLTKYEQTMQKLKNEEDEMAAAYPKQAVEIAKLFRWVKQVTDERERLAAIIAAESGIDSAESFGKGFKAVGKEMVAAMKSYNAARSLQIELDLSAINTQEKFYQLSAGDAATERIAKLNESLVLEQEAFAAIEDSTTAEETRLQIRTKISSINDKILEQQKALYDATPIGGMTNAIQSYAKTAEDIGAQVNSAFTNAFKGMEDALMNFVTTGAVNFKSLANSIISDIIRITTIKPLVNSLAGTLGSLLMPSLSSAGSLQEAGLNTAIPAVLQPGAEFSLTAESTASLTSGLGSTISAALPYVAAAAAVYAGIKAYTPVYNNSTDVGKGTSLALASNPLGWGALALNWATGGGLLGTKWNNTAGGVSLGVENGTVSGQSYVDSERKKAWFGGTDHRTDYGALDSKWSDMLNQQFSAVKDSIYTKSAALGITISQSAMDGYNSAATKINLSGLDSEGQQKAVSEYFRKISNEAIKLLVPDIERLTHLGEDYTAAYERMNALKLTNNNLLMEELKLIGQEGSASYLSLLNTQRQAELLGMDDSTKAIKERIWALQDEKDSLKKVADAMGKVVDNALSAANAIRDIQGGTLSTDSLEVKYRRAMQAFSTNSDSSQSGALGKNLLSLSQQYNASGAGYQTDYATVMSKLNQLTGLTNTTQPIDQQISLLQDIKDALTLDGAKLITTVKDINGATTVFISNTSTGGTSSGGVTDVLSGLPTTATAQSDAAMRAKAGSIAQDVMLMGAGLLSQNLQYDLSGKTVNGNNAPDGTVGTGDAITWMRLANGSLKWSDLGLPAFAQGGITSGLSFAGESGPEAVVPLPDGRRIPVQMVGSADNKESLEELREQNRLLRALLNVSQAGFVRVVDATEKTANSTKGLEKQTRLQAAA